MIESTQEILTAAAERWRQHIQAISDDKSELTFARSPYWKANYWDDWRFRQDAQLLASAYVAGQCESDVLPSP